MQLSAKHQKLLVSSRKCIEKITKNVYATYATRCSWKFVVSSEHLQMWQVQHLQWMHQKHACHSWQAKNRQLLASQRLTSHSAAAKADEEAWQHAALAVTYSLPIATYTHKRRYSCNLQQICTRNAIIVQHMRRQAIHRSFRTTLWQSRSNKHTYTHIYKHILVPLTN